MIVSFGSFFMFVAVLLAETRLLHAKPDFLILIFFAPFALAILYLRLFAFLCPRCGNNFDLLAWGNNIGGINKNLRLCPFCGVDIDVEIDSESGKPIEFLREGRGQSGTEIKNTDIQLPQGKQKANTDIQPPPGKE